MDKRQRRMAVGAGALILCLIAAASLSARPEKSAAGPDIGVVGEARTGAMTSALPQAVRDVQVVEARARGRPLVVIDAGHGGDDPGAPGVSGTVKEKEVTLQLARELRDRLAENGRVRIALTRDQDSTMDLYSRAGVARRLGAELFVSIHADSAANPLARGATVYSVSEVASDADAARFAAAQNGAAGTVAAAADGSVQALLADLAARDEMAESATFAGRLVSKSTGRGVNLRPEPHRFAAFRVLRGAEAPAVLVEGGYLSNAEDEAMLRSPDGRAPLVKALAEAIEAELAVRRTRR